MAKKLGDLNIGDKIKFGSIYYNPIVWKIADKNHRGYPANSITLITNQIIKMLCFDAAEPNNTNSMKQLMGNGRYIYSNIRQWLNSNAPEGQWYTAQHSADQAPDYEHVAATVNGSTTQKGINPYTMSAGFLNGFTAKEQKLLLSTTHSVVRLNTDGGETEPCTDKVFLLSCTEVGLEGLRVCGIKLAMFSDNASRVATVTADCVANSNHPNNPGVGVEWYWMLNESSSNFGNIHVSGVYADGSLSSNTPRSGSAGVRPTCSLSSETLISDSPDADGCYRIIYGSAPSVPNSINVPTTVNGGSSITISWSASTDVDGNLAGYKVERSIDGGSTWIQIYQSTGTSCTDNITFGWTSIQYRVKAYDSEGAESGWKVSPQRNVLNNTPPTAPAVITVPMSVTADEKIMITWTASTDADGNLAGYRVERKVANGSWTQIYDGDALSCWDTITKGWLDVTYRIRAYDSANAYSDYTTSPTRTVDNNTAPTITCNQSGDLGRKSEGFSIAYRVNDVDGDAVTVTEALDGVVKRSYSAVLGAENRFDVTDEYFMCVLNGSHTLTITTQDSGGKSSVLSLTFEKAVHRLHIWNKEPMDAKSIITKTVLTIVRSIPNDAVFTVRLTNNARDETPVWEDATAQVVAGVNYVFDNKTAENGSAYAFDITAERGSSGQGGYINSIGGAFDYFNGLPDDPGILPGGAVEQYTSVEAFPKPGSTDTLYADKASNKLYRWDDETEAYFVVGSDYQQISAIDGGSIDVEP